MLTNRTGRREQIIVDIKTATCTYFRTRQMFRAIQKSLVLRFTTPARVKYRVRNKMYTVTIMASRGVRTKIRVRRLASGQKSRKLPWRSNVWLTHNTIYCDFVVRTTVEYTIDVILFYSISDSNDVNNTTFDSYVKKRNHNFSFDLKSGVLRSSGRPSRESPAGYIIIIIIIMERTLTR